MICKVCGKEFKKLHAKGKCGSCYMKEYRKKLKFKQHDNKYWKEYHKRPEVVERRNRLYRIKHIERRYIPSKMPRLIKEEYEMLKELVK